jgi:hypothetical protein
LIGQSSSPANKDDSNSNNNNNKKKKKKKKKKSIRPHNTKEEEVLAVFTFRLLNYCHEDEKCTNTELKNQMMRYFSLLFPQFAWH